MIVVSHLFAMIRPSGRSARSRCSRITGPLFIFTGFTFLFWLCGRGLRINRHMTMPLGPGRYCIVARLSFRSVVMLIVYKIVVWRKSTLAYVMIRLQTIGSIYGLLVI